jgi:hypothetical protein
MTEGDDPFEKAKRRIDREFDAVEAVCEAQAERRGLAGAAKAEYIHQCKIHYWELPPEQRTLAMVDKTGSPSKPAARKPHPAIMPPVKIDSFKVLDAYLTQLAEGAQHCLNEAQKAPTTQRAQAFLKECMWDLGARLPDPPSLLQVRERVTEATGKGAARPRTWMKEEGGIALEGAKVVLSDLDVARTDDAADAAPAGHEMRTCTTGLCVPFKVKEIVRADIVRWILAHEKRWTQEIVPRLPAPPAKWRTESNKWVDGLPAALQYPAWRFYNGVCGAYERLFAEGVRSYCRRVNDVLNCEVTGPVFAQYYGDSPSIKQYTKLGQLIPPGSSANWENSARYIYHNMALQAQDTKAKLDCFKRTLLHARSGAADLTGAVPNYLLTGFLPYNVKLYLTNTAEFRGVTTSWIRNLTFGWRRKLDPALPAAFQMERLPAQRQQLRVLLEKTLEMALKDPHCAGLKKYRRAYRRVLQQLGRKHLLHLLIHPAGVLRGVIYEGRNAYYTRARELHQRLTPSLKFAHVLATAYPHRMQFSKAEFLQAATATLSRMAEIIAKYADREREFPKGAPARDRYVRYRKVVVTHQLACQFLHDQIQALLTYEEEVKRGVRKRDTLMETFNTTFQALFAAVLPSASQLRGIAAVLGSVRVLADNLDVLQFETVFRRTLRAQLLMAGVYKNASDLPPIGRRKLFAGLAAIVSQACFHKYGRELVTTTAAGVAQPRARDVRARIAALMITKRLITPPFCSPNRRSRAVQPLELVQGYEYEPLYRVGPYASMAALVRDDPHALIFKLSMKRVQTLWGAKAASGRLREEFIAKHAGRSDLFTKDLLAFLDGLFSTKGVKRLLRALPGPDAAEKAIRRAIPDEKQRPGDKKTLRGTALGKLARLMRAGFVGPAGLPMEARLTKQMAQILCGSSASLIHHARILPPAPASGKMVAQVVVSAPRMEDPSRDVLAPRTNFYRAERAYGSALPPPMTTPIARYAAQLQRCNHPTCLGVDTNRLSEHSIAAGTVQHTRSGTLTQTTLDVRGRLVPILLLDQKLRWVDYPTLIAGIQQTVTLPKALEVQDYLNAVKRVDHLLAKLATRSGTRQQLEQILDLRTLWACRKSPRLLMAVARQVLERYVDRATLDFFAAVPRPKEVVKRVKDHLYQQVRAATGAAKAQQAARLQTFRHLEDRYTKGLLPEIARTARALDFYKNQQVVLQALQANAITMGSTEFAAWRVKLLRRLLRVPRTQIRARKARPGELEALAALLQGKIGRLQAELTLLHRRKGHLKAAIDGAFELAATGVTLDSGAWCIALEDLEVSTRGARKGFAELLAQMPKKAALRSAIGKRVSQAWSVLAGKQVDVEVYAVDPRGTSQYCAVLVGDSPCGAKLQAVAGDYDLQRCPVHGIRQRHINSALEIARRGLKLWKRRE